MSEEKKIYIAQWCFSLFGIVGATGMFSKGGIGILAGLVILLSALIINPVSGKIIDKKIPFLASKPSLKIFLQFLISFFVFIVGIMVAPHQQTIDTLPDKTAENSSVVDTTELNRMMISDEESVESVSETQEKPSEMEVEEAQCDSLQKIFMELSFDSTINDVEKIIADYNLEYTRVEYSGTPKDIVYQLAYNHDAALQQHGSSEDCIRITFNQENNSFMFAEYVNYEEFATALLYNYGVYYDFREKVADNKYSGYYYHPFLGSKEGIVIEYDNGHTTETSYHLCDNAENTIKQVLGLSSNSILVLSEEISFESETERLTTEETITESETEGPTETPTLPPTEATTIPVTQPSVPVVISHEYWINTDSEKFHFSTCHTIKNREEPHWQIYTGDRNDLISQGYEPCGVCEP